MDRTKVSQTWIQKKKRKVLNLWKYFVQYFLFARNDETNNMINLLMFLIILQNAKVLIQVLRNCFWSTDQVLLLSILDPFQSNYLTIWLSIINKCVSIIYPNFINIPINTHFDVLEFDVTAISHFLDDLYDGLIWMIVWVSNDSSTEIEI